MRHSWGDEGEERGQGNGPAFRFGPHRADPGDRRPRRLFDVIHTGSRLRPGRWSGEHHLPSAPSVRAGRRHSRPGDSERLGCHLLRRDQDPGPLVSRAPRLHPEVHRPSSWARDGACPGTPIPKVPGSSARSRSRHCGRPGTTSSPGIPAASASPVGMPRWTVPRTRPATSVPSSTGSPPDPGSQLDAPGDPRMGMVGGSYGGGIQLVTAATDCRIDAIVPTIAWHSLVTSLDKANTAKSGWGNLLANLSSSDHVDPEVTGQPDVGECHRHDHRGRAPMVRGPGPWRPGLPHPHPDTDRPGHRRHAVHPAGGGGELRDPAQERGPDGHALVLRGPRRVPDPSGQPDSCPSPPPSTG